VVDARRVERILRRVSEDLGALRSYAAGASSLRADAARLGHTKYLFVTAIEGCVDVAQHLCASESWGPPATNADAVRILARHGVVEEGLADSIASAVGFRNVLVHLYTEVDDERVVDHLAGLGHLEQFVADVAAWVEAR